jgi:hypothetical protein
LAGRCFAQAAISTQTTQTTRLPLHNATQNRKFQDLRGFSASFPRTFADGHKSIN